MLRRLFLTLLIACLATPAIAMPMASQEQLTMATGHCDDQMPSTQPDEQRASLHGCIGCLATIAFTSFAHEPAPIERTPYRQVHRSLIPNPRDGPDTPPPRLA